MVGGVAEGGVEAVAQVEALGVADVSEQHGVLHPLSHQRDFGGGWSGDSRARRHGSEELGLPCASHSRKRTDRHIFLVVLLAPPEHSGMAGFRISRLLLVVALLALAVGSVSCASTVRLGGPEHSCSPGFEPSNELGTIAVQQRGAGYGIQWGVYPTLPAVTYTVDVYVNNRRDDHKVQAYPPHGSVKANQVSTGDVFRLEGQAVDAAGNVGYFYLQCLAA